MPAVAGIVLCLGCAMPEVGGRHRCAKNKPLLPYGGFCGCPLPGCGPDVAPTGHHEGKMSSRRVGVRR